MQQLKILSRSILEGGEVYKVEIKEGNNVDTAMVPAGNFVNFVRDMENVNMVVCSNFVVQNGKLYIATDIPVEEMMQAEQAPKEQVNSPLKPQLITGIEEVGKVSEVPTMEQPDISKGPTTKPADDLSDMELNVARRVYQDTIDNKKPVKHPYPHLSFGESFSGPHGYSKESYKQDDNCTAPSYMHPTGNTVVIDGVEYVEALSLIQTECMPTSEELTQDMIDSVEPNKRYLYRELTQEEKDKYDTCHKPQYKFTRPKTREYIENPKVRRLSKLIGTRGGLGVINSTLKESKRELPYRKCIKEEFNVPASTTDDTNILHILMDYCLLTRNTSSLIDVIVKSHLRSHNVKDYKYSRRVERIPNPEYNGAKARDVAEQALRKIEEKISNGFSLDDDPKAHWYLERYRQILEGCLYMGHEIPINIMHSILVYADMDVSLSLYFPYRQVSKVKTLNGVSAIYSYEAAVIRDIVAYVRKAQSITGTGCRRLEHKDKSKIYDFERRRLDYAMSNMVCLDRVIRYSLGEEYSRDLSQDLEQALDVAVRIISDKARLAVIYQAEQNGLIEPGTFEDIVSSEGEIPSINEYKAKNAIKNYLVEYVYKDKLLPTFTIDSFDPTITTDSFVFLLNDIKQKNLETIKKIDEANKDDNKYRPVHLI